MIGFLGTKLGMTRLVDEESGKVLPVTLIEVGTQTVTQVKTVDSDGYEAVQLSALPLKKSSKTRKFKLVREFRTEGEDVTFEKGHTYGLEVIEGDATVDLSSVSKGKGFAGRIKRHNQARGPMSHGSKNHRQMGSTGTCKPNRTIKGYPMPGHMGVDRVSFKSVPVVKVDAESGIIAVKGTVPGANGAMVELKVN